MSFHIHNGLRYLSFEIFQDQPIIQAVFTRQGGCSPIPWHSLNMGGSVGDDPSRVVENRRRAFETTGRSLDSIFHVWQVHGADVVYADSPRSPEAPFLQADAILTDRNDVTLFMRFADCVPILLYDPHHKVIGMVHAGWQGTVKKVVENAVERMVSRYHSKAEELLAAIGPSIGPCHYIVGDEVIKQVYRAFAEEARTLINPIYQDYSDSDRSRPDFTFDLWASNQLLLKHAGVHQIQVVKICTACHLEDWFSHRAESGNTGRFGVIMGLNDGIE